MLGHKPCIYVLGHKPFVYVQGEMSRTGAEAVHLRVWAPDIRAGHSVFHYFLFVWQNVKPCMYVQEEMGRTEAEAVHS